MEIPKKILIFIFPVAVIIALVYIMFAPKQEVYKVLQKKLDRQTAEPDIILKGSTFSEIVNGVKYWEIRAASSNLSKKGGFAHLKDINGIFFENNRPVLGVIAPTANWNLNKKEIIIDDPIGKSVSKLEDKRIIYKELGRGGFLFASKEMFWGISDKKIVCRGGVVLKKDTSVVKGELLRTDVGLGMAELTGNPEAILNKKIKVLSPRFIIDGKQNSINIFDGVELISSGINIFADNGKYSEQKKEAALWGEVKVIKDDMTLTGDRFLFGVEDKNVTGFGNILVSYKDIKASGGRAFYSDKEKVVMLTDKVKADKAGNVVFGDKVTVDLVGGKLTILGSSKAVISEEQLTTMEIK